MVHRKSCYKLTYKKIPDSSISSGYLENYYNRNVNGERERKHQPLPFEEEPCDCDEENDGQMETCDQKKTVRKRSPSHDSSYTETLEGKREARKDDRNYQRTNEFCKEQTSTSKFEPCFMCGCEFHKNLVSTMPLTTNLYDLKKRYDNMRCYDFREKYEDEEILSNLDNNKSDGCSSKFDVKEAVQVKIDKTNDDREKSDINISRCNSSVKTEQPFGVYKLNKQFGEIDLLPATVSHPREKRPSKYWNSEGDRIPFEDRWRKLDTSGNVFLRKNNTCLSHSLPNVNRLSSSYLNEKNRVKNYAKPTTYKRISWSDGLMQSKVQHHRNVTRHSATDGCQLRNKRYSVGDLRRGGADHDKTLSTGVRGKMCSFCGNKW